MTGDAFRDGWCAFWAEVSGQQGPWRWMGWAAASLVSRVLYELVKALWGAMA